MKKLKTQKGITLVALIITIVVLLILAMAGIGAIQDSKIIAHAQNAATQFEQKQQLEQEYLKEYEEMLKDTPNSLAYINGFFGPIADGSGNETWCMFNQNKIVLIMHTQNFEIISCMEYDIFEKDEAINILPESEKQEALDYITEIEKVYGQINSAIICEGENGSKNVYGLVLDNQNKIINLMDKNNPLITERNNNPTDEIKNIVYKTKGDYITYKAPSNDADKEYYIIVDYVNETLDNYECNTKTNTTKGIYVKTKVTEVTDEVTITVNGVDKIIGQGAYKMESDSLGYIYYIENKGTENERIYRREENNLKAEQLVKVNFDITKLGYIVQ